MQRFRSESALRRRVPQLGVKFVDTLLEPREAPLLVFRALADHPGGEAAVGERLDESVELALQLLGGLPCGI